MSHIVEMGYIRISFERYTKAKVNFPLSSELQLMDARRD